MNAKFSPIRHYPIERGVRRTCAMNQAYIRISPYLAGAVVAGFAFLAWDALVVLIGAVQAALGAV